VFTTSEKSKPPAWLEHPESFLLPDLTTDRSSWSKVIPLLQQNGFNVVAGADSPNSLADDIAVTRNLMAAQIGPVH
jgi:hypothetical protein